MVRLTKEKKVQYRHEVLSELWVSLVALKGMLPLTNEWPLDVVHVNNYFNEAFAPIHELIVLEKQRVLEAGYTEEEAEGHAFKRKLPAIWFALKSVEVSDTPNWYSLDRETAVRLSEESIEGTTSDDLLFPFDCFFIEVPHGVISLTGDSDDVLSIRCIGVARAILREDKYKGIMKIAGDGGEYPSGEYYFTREYGFFEGGEYDGQPNHVFTTNKLEKGFVYRDYDENLRSQSWSDVAYEESMKLHRLIIGFLKLAKRQSFEFVSAARKKKRGRVPTNSGVDIGKLLNSGTWVLGNKTKMSSTVTKPSNKTHPTTTSSKSTSVSGHLRRYRCGPRNDWHYEVREIRPFRRGGQGIAMGHTYEMVK